MSLPLTKICNPADLEHPDFKEPLDILDETQKILQLGDVLDPLPHPLRMWEYGQALRAFSLSKGTRVLEVGGSTSLLMPAMVVGSKERRDFTQLESPSWINADTERRFYLQQSMAAHGARHSFALLSELPDEEFDFIACVSVIENLPFSEEKKVQFTDPAGAEWHTGHSFMRRFVWDLMAKLAPGGILFLTSDIGEKQPDVFMFGHMRPPGIWCPSTWWWLANDLAPEGGKLELVGEPDFTWTGPHVYGSYNFASMCLQRKG